MLVKSSAFGLFSLAIANHAGAVKQLSHFRTLPDNRPPERYPAIGLSIAVEVVGLSHFDLEKLKKLVDPRPELSRASWDWGFGDWESAIDAATHAGRTDIVDYLISKGAVPTLFTQAMLGRFETVRTLILHSPGIEKSMGPHGLSLLQHVRTGIDSEGTDKEGCKKLLDFLIEKGGAGGINYLPLSDTEKQKYLGDYKYGDGKEDGFSVKLNMRKNLSFGILGKSGGALLHIGEDQFTYNAAPSVNIRFTSANQKVISLTITEPGFSITALKV